MVAALALLGSQVAPTGTAKIVTATINDSTVLNSFDIFSSPQQTSNNPLL